jgi:hypothetical protein
MCTRRGKSQFKKTIDSVKSVCKSRGHELIQFERGKVDINPIPQQSRIVVKCTKCNTVWDTKLQTYTTRIGPSMGCRKCYNKNVTDPKIYPNSPCIQKPHVKGRPKRREGIEALREAHSQGQFGHIQNRADLKKMLKENPNKNNDYALKLVEAYEKREADGIVTKGDVYSKHHVLPLHAQGSPDSWNIISLTKEEHDKVHQYCYEIYQELGDLKATYATASDLARSLSLQTSEQSLEAKESKAKEKCKKANLEKRTAETIAAIEKGMIWKHADGTTVKIVLNSVETIEEIKQKLIESLPKNHCDRCRMESASSANNYIRNHITTFFKNGTSHPILKPQNSVYGFNVQPLT